MAFGLAVGVGGSACAALTFSLTWGWAGDSRQDAAQSALTNSLARFNAYGNFNGGNDGNVEAAYNAGVPTAQAGYNGTIEYGGTWPNDRVTIHELNHWLGSGTWGHTYDGPRTIALFEQFEGVGARISTDGTHFWPYGLNYDNEWSELNARRNVALMYAARADWGIGSTANPTAWNATSVSLTSSDPAGASGFNRYSNWSDGTFAHPNADYSTGAFDLRTPNGYPSWTFAGKSLTVNQGGRLLYNSWGHSGVTTIADLRINNGTVRHDQNDGNPNAKLDTFRLAGAVTLVGNGVLDAAQGDMVVESVIRGDGSLTKTGAGTLLLSGSSTYAGATSISQGTLVLNGATGFGQTTLSGGSTLAGDGAVRGALVAQAASTVRVGGAGLPLQLPSGHVLLDDFNGYALGATATATRDVWSAEITGTANSNIALADPSHSKALKTIGGAAWRGAKRNLAGTDAAVRVGETKTYFWQVQPSYTSNGAGWDYDFMMGLSPNASSIDSTDAWRDFAVMPFINNDATTPYINAEAPTEPWWALMSPGQWHNVWVVVDNDPVNPTYDLYYASESDPNNPVLVAANANWRNFAAGQDLNAIGFMAAGNTGTEFLVDNIYYVSGEDTSLPLGQTPTLTGETLTVGGDFNLQSGATLAIDLAQGASDRVEVTGAATLDGVLVVTLDPGYTPVFGDEFTVLTAASLANNIALGGPNGSLFSTVASTATDLVLTAVSALEGDYNNDGRVDAADYTL
ncbi:MAG: autotransporter-associated beta strand repeat-containing protein, partial [Planctomycetales bacterium]|nr:autotransporter-associated beta strand repeat-containing protein [Planctomycetales bacterium]